MAVARKVLVLTFKTVSGIDVDIQILKPSAALTVPEIKAGMATLIAANALGYSTEGLEGAITNDKIATIVGAEYIMREINPVVLG